MVGKVAVALALLGLTACSPVDLFGSRSPTPSASPSPKLLEPLVVVQTHEMSGDTISLLHLDGSKAVSKTLAGPGQVFVTSSGVYVLVGTQLDLLSRSGMLTHLDNAPTLQGNNGIIFSPDGNRWLWSTGDCGGPSKVHSGSRTESDRVTGTYSDGQGRVAAAMGWFKASGPLFTWGICTGCEQYPFCEAAFTKNPQVLNLSNGTMSGFAPADCSVDGAVADDGTYACAGGANLPFIIHRANGKLDSFGTVQGAFAYEQSDGYAVAASYSGEYPNGSYDTYSLVGSQVAKFGPSGWKPISFLPDGSLFETSVVNRSTSQQQFVVVDGKGLVSNQVTLPANTYVDGVMFSG